MYQIAEIAGLCAIANRDVMPRYCAWLALPHHIQRDAIQIADTFCQSNGQRIYDVEVLSSDAIYCATQKPSTPAKYKRTPNGYCQ